MADPHFLPSLRLPSDFLIGLDSRAFHFAVQPYHHLVRALHVLAMSAFFGGIGLLDLRLIGLRSTVPLKAFADHALPWVYVCFGVAAASGVVLFLYDPVHVGSHLYFVPKLVFVGLGLANAVGFHRMGFVRAMAAEARLPGYARVAGAVSLLLWIMVIVCSSLNAEGPPKLLLK